MRRLLSIILTLAMLSLLVACGNGSTDEQSPAQDKPTQETGEGSENSDNPTAIVKDKLTLTITAVPIDPTGRLGNDQPFWQEMEKRTNIHLEWNVLPQTGTAEKFTLLMSSGDLPDIVNWTTGGDVIKYGMQGAFIPLEDLINQHAPNIKKVLDNPPIDNLPYQQNVWAEITARDGHVYTVPAINSSNAIGPVFGIRADWLQKLGLEVPKTIDELYNVLKAFREKDPNGNGKADEVPFITDANHTIRVLPIVNAFGAHIDFYVDQKDNIVKYGPIEDSYKEGLQFLNKLYSEGLLDNEYLTITRDQWLAKAGGNIGGMMFVWPLSGIGAANNELAKLDPNFKFEPMQPVEGPRGDKFKGLPGTLVRYRTSITTSNEHPVETIKWLNYVFSDEGYMLANYGIEGKHYTMVNGRPQPTDYVLHNPDGKDPEAVKTGDGIKPVIAWWSDWAPDMSSADPASKKAWELHWSPGLVEPPFPTLSFSEEDLSTRNRIMAEINTYKSEMVDKFIMGVEPLDKFDEYVQQIKQMGMDEVLELSNIAYEEYKARTQK